MIARTGLVRTVGYLDVDPCTSELVGWARRLPPSAQEGLRLTAGRPREDVAAVFQVSLKTVDNWWAR